MKLGSPVKIKKEADISVNVITNKKNGQIHFTPSKKELKKKMNMETLPKHMRIKIKW